MKVVVVLVLTGLFVVLTRQRWVRIDLAFPWYFALLILGLVSMSEGFIAWIARQLDIVDPPLAIILIALFLILGLSTYLSTSVGEMRKRQIMVARQLAATELDVQEKSLSSSN